MARQVPTGAEFEDQVRAVARALWPKPGSGASEIVDGREGDCFFPTEEVTHYIECTTRRDLEKIRTDVKKMVAHREKEAKRGVLVKLWIVTHDEPTPDQRTEAKSKRVDILSLAQFRRKLIDGQSYITVRNSYPFGSAADPRTESPDISGLRYQPTTVRQLGVDQTFSVEDITKELLAGRCGALIGDFGMGKSLTVREIYRTIQSYHSDIAKVPIVLNLRDHWGQTDISEALHRHAMRIGFEHPHQLVRAFHAGLLIVILDGFDETAPTSWNTKSEPRLRELRRDSVQLAASFVRAARGKTGVLVVGRRHFFDKEDEMRDSLALRREDLLLLIDEFSDPESKEFLRANGFTKPLPDWLPRRPLFLAYLAAHSILQRVLEGDAGESGEAWNSLVNQICERESQIHPTLDAGTVRSILEALASMTRSQKDECGAITGEDIARAFRAITGAEPDALARPLLNRIPGLGVLDPQKGTRTFIDSQMLDALRGGDVARLIGNPWDSPTGAQNWQQGLGTLGISVAAKQAMAKHGPGTCRLALVAAREAIERHKAPTLAADAVQVARETTTEVECTFEGLVLDGGTFQYLDLSEGSSVVELTLRNCEIGELVIPVVSSASLGISSCIIHRISGCANTQSVPVWIQNSEIGEYDVFATNAQILDRDDLPMPLRVAMTILRKLYLQWGHARKENALSRGIGPHGQKWVNPVLEVLATERVAIRVKTGGRDATWHSSAGMRRRVMAVLDAPGASRDEIAIRCRGMVTSAPAKM